MPEVKTKRWDAKRERRVLDRIYSSEVQLTLIRELVDEVKDNYFRYEPKERPEKMRMLAKLVRERLDEMERLVGVENE